MMLQGEPRPIAVLVLAVLVAAALLAVVPGVRAHSFSGMVGSLPEGARLPANSVRIAIMADGPVAVRHGKCAARRAGARAEGVTA